MGHDRSIDAPVPSSPSLGEWLAQWLATRALKVSPKTYSNELSHAPRYLGPLSAVALSALTPGTIEDWLATIERRGLAARPGRGQPHTVRICHSLISSVLRDAVKHRIIDASPIAHVAWPLVRRHHPSS